MRSYFATPVAYVFIVIFLILSGAFTFYLGNFYERGQADLQSFFQYHTILYLFLVPAVSMRLWAEERKSGTIELLLTLPVTMWQAVFGKFLAAWVFNRDRARAHVSDLITVNYLGSPDNGAIFASYIGSFLRRARSSRSARASRRRRAIRSSRSSSRSSSASCS